MYSADSKMDEFNDGLILDVGGEEGMEYRLNAGYKGGNIDNGKDVDWGEEIGVHRNGNYNDNNSGAKEHFNGNDYDQKGFK